MSYTRYVPIMLLLTALLGGCVSNQTKLEEGIRCFKSEQYRKAFIRLKPLAESGQPDAQYAIGYMYFYGQGVNENHKKALFWIKCAAKKGQPEALQALKVLDHRIKN